MASAAPLTQIPLLLDRKTVEQHSLRRGEPDWLRESRLHALERFTPESWPSGEEEEWRRFPLSGLPTGPLASTLDHLPGIQFKLEPDAIAAGVIFKGLTRAALDNPQLVRPHIVNGDGIPSHAAFRAAADALWSAGSSFVHVPAGVVVRQPLVLEILTNDVVRCGHGATAGALSDEELFYAMSRGFDRDAAQQLLVHGFFRRVINELKDEHVRQRVLNAVRPRIGNIAEMGVLE